MNQKLFDKGMKLRRQVMGEKHIAKRSASGDDYTRRHYELVTEFAWGTIWSRPGLPLKMRSLVTLGVLAALDRPDELDGHVNGALNNGATPDEIYEALLHAGVYCGFPAANGAIRVAVQVFKDRQLI